VADVAVYTAITNEYDAIVPPPDMPGIDFIAFTDNPAPRERWRGWQPRDVTKIAPRDLSPRMLAKYPKLMPHLVLPDYEVTIWIDGSHRITSPQAIVETMDCLARGDAGFALHKHPWRDCIYDEAEASLELWKYATQPIEEQVEEYRERGHPEHWGLWACGSMARVNGERINAAMEHWWAECLAWSYQDQISLPVVMREAGWRPDEFPHQQYASPWFQIQGHPRDNE